MITTESLKLRHRRDYMIRLANRPDSVLITDPSTTRMGIKILEIQYRKLEAEDDTRRTAREGE